MAYALATPTDVQKNDSPPDSAYAGTRKMTPDEWSKIPNNPRQRNTEDHASRAKHLKAFDPSHCKVSMALLPNGEFVKLDGHTRCYLWQTGKLLPPMTVHVDVWKCGSLDAAKELYTRFDNKAAVETATDQMSGAIREAGLDLTSEILRRGRITSALKETHRLFGNPDATTYEMIQEWAKEIVRLDVCNGTKLRFPSGVITAALLTFRKHGGDASDFWITYAKGEGEKISGEMDAVQALDEKILTLRREKAFAGQSHTLRSVGYALSAFDGHRKGKMYAIGALRPYQSVKLKAWLSEMRSA